MASIGMPPGPSAAPIDDGLRTPRWGLGDALGGWIGAHVVGIVAASILLGVMGYQTSDEFSLAEIALVQLPFWLALVGVPIWAAAVKGNGWVRDFGARVRAIDVPLGLVIGFASQVILVPLVSLPILWLSGTSNDDLSRPARELADKADSTVGVVLFILIVGVAAPIAEEIFWRGLALRSFEHRFSAIAALLLSSLWFGASHLQPLQLAGLTAAGIVFGLLAQQFGRLGPAVFAHMGFNLTAAIQLVWLT